MTRITPSQSNEQVQEAAETLSQRLHRHYSAKSAVLYRGTVFTYGDAASRTPMLPSRAATLMIARLARRRAMLRNAMKSATAGKAHLVPAKGHDDKRVRAARPYTHPITGRNGGHGGGQRGDDGHEEQEESGAHPQRQSNNGKQGGGRQGSDVDGGQKRNAHRDAQIAAAAVGATGRKTAASPATRLERVAAPFDEPGQEDARFEAVRSAWSDDLNDLAGRLRADASTLIDLLVIDLSIDFLSIQRRIGRLPPLGLGAFVERAKALPTEKCRAWPESLAPALLPGEGPQRTFSLLPLIPLLALNGDRPSTNTQRGRALATLRSMRAAHLGRGPRPVAANADTRSPRPVEDD